MNWTKGSSPKLDGGFNVWIVDVNRKAKIGRAFPAYAWYETKVNAWFDRDGDYYVFSDKITHYIHSKELGSPNDI